MSIPISRISPASCLAASPPRISASRASPISAISSVSLKSMSHIAAFRIRNDLRRRPARSDYSSGEDSASLASIGASASFSFAFLPEVVAFCQSPLRRRRPGPVFIRSRAVVICQRCPCSFSVSALVAANSVAIDDERGSTSLRREERCHDDRRAPAIFGKGRLGRAPAPRRAHPAKCRHNRACRTRSDRQPCAAFAHRRRRAAIARRQRDSADGRARSACRRRRAKPRHRPSRATATSKRGPLAAP